VLRIFKISSSLSDRSLQIHVENIEWKKKKKQVYEKQKNKKLEKKLKTEKMVRKLLKA